MKNLKTFDNAKKVSEVVTALEREGIQANINRDGNEFTLMISVHDFIRARNVVLALDKEKAS
jgi:hypothetical protein